MYELEGLWIFVFQDDTCLARVFHLMEEGAELDAPLVIDEGIGEEAAAIPIFENLCTQVDVLSVTH